MRSMTHTVMALAHRNELAPTRQKAALMKLTGSVALVTGANRGLGARLVSELLNAGAAKVYGAARTPGAVANADPRVRPLALDITDAASVAAAAAVARDVSVLINNAGVLAFGTALDGDLDAFERDLRTNYIGTLRVTRAFAPALERNAPAAVVNVLTLIALAPVTAMAGYSASKAAAHSITQALRAELSDRGIAVLGAYPGGIDTDMLAGVEAEKAAPEVVAERIVASLSAADTIVFPDDASASAGALYLSDPVKLEHVLTGAVAG
jgi:NAD(P)-dependent dehydrogenase (short-subunit alcohol dehydrogenase family)